MQERIRNRTLLIVEGQHEKEKLLKTLVRVFPKMNISFENVIVFETNIYQLYDGLIAEYDEQWDDYDVDIPYVVSKKKHYKEKLFKRDFTDIFLIFDYERHDPNFSEEKITRMQEYFSDSTDVGMLYLNYPMVEAYLDGDVLEKQLFMEKKFTALMEKGKEYKNSVSNSHIAKLIKLPQKLDEILDEKYECNNAEERKNAVWDILNLDDKSFSKQALESVLQHVIPESEIYQAAMQISATIESFGYLSAGYN